MFELAFAFLVLIAKVTSEVFKFAKIRFIYM